METINQSQAKRGQPAKEESDRKKPQTFAALQSEIAVWKQKAAADNRPVSQWIRLRLLAMDAQDEERAARVIEGRDRHA